MDDDRGLALDGAIDDSETRFGRHKAVDFAKCFGVGIDDCLNRLFGVVI
jgi:hypothetical protein